MGGQTYPLNEGRSVVLNAAGFGQTFLAPPGVEKWRVTRYAVVTNQASTVTTMPICSLYLDSISDANLVDSTYTGARDAGDCDLVLQKGQQLIATWTGGVAASIATLSIIGERILY